MATDIQPDIPPSPAHIDKLKQGMTRRDFLKKSGAVLAAVLGNMAGQSDQTIAVAERISAEPLLVTILAEAKEILPPIYKEKYIPTNKDYENPADILIEAIRLSKTKIFLTRIPGYLSNQEALRRAVGPVTRALRGEIKPAAIRLEMTAKDQTLEMISVRNFSRNSFNGSVDLVSIDPGCGMVERALNNASLTAGSDRFTESQLAELNSGFEKEITTATNHFVHLRGEKKGPLPIAECIAYFIRINKGDLSKALWDSTLYLKIMARNDPATLLTKETIDQAIFLGDLFLDQFSLHAPVGYINRLYQEYKQEGADVSLLEEASSSSHPELKTFMPVNRSGEYYHCLNIMALATTTFDPEVCLAAIFLYYAKKDFGGMGNSSDHGRSKIEADLVLATHARDLKYVASRFLK